MATTRNIEININNGIDYDVLYPKVNLENAINILGVNNGGTGVTSYSSLASILNRYIDISNYSVRFVTWIGSNQEKTESEYTVNFPSITGKQLRYVFIGPNNNPYDDVSASQRGKNGAVVLSTTIKTDGTKFYTKTGSEYNGFNIKIQYNYEAGTSDNYPLGGVRIQMGYFGSILSNNGLTIKINETINCNVYLNFYYAIGLYD